MKYIVVETQEVNSYCMGLPVSCLSNIVGIFSTEEMVNNFIEKEKQKGKNNLYYCKVFTDIDIFYGKHESEGLSKINGD